MNDLKGEPAATIAARWTQDGGGPPARILYFIFYKNASKIPFSIGS